MSPLSRQSQKTLGKWKVSGFLVNLISTISIMKSFSPSLRSHPSLFPSQTRELLNSALRLSPTLGRFLNMHTAVCRRPRKFSRWNISPTQDFIQLLFPFETIVPRCLNSCSWKNLSSLRIINRWHGTMIEFARF